MEEIQPLQEKLPVAGRVASALASPNLIFSCLLKGLPLAAANQKPADTGPVAGRRANAQASVALKGELDTMAMWEIVFKFKPFTFQEDFYISAPLASCLGM